MKAVLRHHLRLSTQHTSFILEILIGYVAKNSAKLTYFFSHTCVTLHIVSINDIKKSADLPLHESFFYISNPLLSTKNLAVIRDGLLWKILTHSRLAQNEDLPNFHA